jgi:predicted dehydrogenase
MVAFLELLAQGKLDVEALITQRAQIEEAPAVYEELVSGVLSPLGIVLEYAPSDLPAKTLASTAGHSGPTPDAVGLIGTGSFAQRILIPALRQAGFSLASVGSAAGLSARDAANRFGFERFATPDEVVSDPEVGLVAIATRHSSHAQLSIAALDAGKHVFVEKPPCLKIDEFIALRDAVHRSGGPLSVGFNRRHAPLARALRDHVRRDGVPVEVLIRVNAGELPADHWLNDLEEGGGRLIGEGCHFVDLACWVVGLAPSRVAASISPSTGRQLAAGNAFRLTLEFSDRSVATIVYGVGGATGLPKEYVEAHAGGRSAILDDFRSLRLYEGRRCRRMRDRHADKGHCAQFVHLRQMLAGEETPEQPSPLETMAATFACLRSALTGQSVDPKLLTGEAA